MARPSKAGIDYYSMDVDFLRDLKIRKILRANGASSIAILICLLGNIYKDKGYYMKWDKDICFLVADEVGTSEVSVEELIKKAIQVDFFDKEKFDAYQILTSHGIQERYLKAVERRTEISLEDNYCIHNVDNNSVNVNRNSIFVSKSTQSKVKESKVNKSIVNNIASTRAIDTPKENSADVLEQMERAVEPLDDMEKQLKRILVFYQENLNPDIAPIIHEKLMYWGRELPPDVVIKALEEAVNNSVQKFNYVEAVLNNWAKAGVKTVAHAEQMIAKHKQQTSRTYKAKPKKQEVVPSWFGNKQQATNNSVNTGAPDINVSEEELRRQMAEVLSKPMKQVADDEN